MVVTRKNVSAYEGVMPLDGASRNISTTGPLYEKQAVLDLIVKARKQLEVDGQLPVISYFTNDCETDVQNLGWEMEDLINFLEDAISRATYRKSVWCDGTNPLFIAACDDYIFRKRRVWDEKWLRYKDEDTYFKLAIGKEGLLLLMVSCHGDGGL